MKTVTVTTTVVHRAPVLPPPPVPALPPLWMHREDWHLDLYHYGIRSCAPCPAIIPMLERPQTVDKQLQFFVRGINYRMSIQHVSSIYGHTRAFSNGTGYGDPKDPRKNYLTGEGMTGEDLQFDKIRTCIRSVMTGTPGYSLAVALAESVTAVTDRARKRSTALAARPIRSLLTANNVLIVSMLDGSKPPPLKPGRTYPQRVEDIDIDDYLYTPETHRHFFFAANIINKSGEIVPFPNGARYDWTGDNLAYTWLPHVSRFEIRHPLRYLVPVDTLPSPYRFV